MVEATIPEGYDVASKSIVYKNVKFKSILEAQWAAFFDMMHIKWEYEQHKLPRGDGHYYVPDFYLPELDVFVEAKGARQRWRIDMEKVVRAASKSNTNIMIAPPVFNQIGNYSEAIPTFGIMYVKDGKVGFSECFFYVLDYKGVFCIGDPDDPETYPAPWMKMYYIACASQKLHAALNLTTANREYEKSRWWCEIADRSFRASFVDPNYVKIQSNVTYLNFAYKMAKGLVVPESYCARRGG